MARCSDCAKLSARPVHCPNTTLAGRRRPVGHRDPDPARQGRSAIGRNVRDDQHAGAGRCALHEPKRPLGVPVAEEALSAADHERMDHQRVFVHQIVLYQRLYELAAADHPEVLAVLRLSRRPPEAANPAMTPRPKTSSKYCCCQPPASNPPLGSSSGYPGDWITPSSVMNSLTITLRISSSFQGQFLEPPTGRAERSCLPLSHPGDTGEAEDCPARQLLAQSRTMGQRRGSLPSASSLR